MKIKMHLGEPITLKEIANSLVILQNKIVNIEINSSFNSYDNDARRIHLDGIKLCIQGNLIWFNILIGFMDKYPIEVFTKIAGSPEVSIVETDKIMSDINRSSLITGIHFKIEVLFHSILKELDSSRFKKRNYA